MFTFFLFLTGGHFNNCADWTLIVADLIFSNHPLIITGQAADFYVFVCVEQQLL